MDSCLSYRPKESGVIGISSRLCFGDYTVELVVINMFELHHITLHSESCFRVAAFRSEFSTIYGVDRRKNHKAQGLLN